MSDKENRKKPHDPEKQKAAKERVKGWWDSAKPTKADDETTRDDKLEGTE